MNKNIFDWVKETKVIDIIGEAQDHNINLELQEGWKIINSRTEKLMRFKVLTLEGKEQLTTFEIMLTRYVLGR